MEMNTGRMKGPLIVAAGLCAVLIMAYVAVFQLPYWQKPRSIPVRFNTEKLQNGDLVFRNGNSFMSDRIVELSPERIKLSHGGILVKEGDSFYVIHVVGDHFANYVRKEPLESFFSHSVRDHFCITRHTGPEEIRTAIAERALLYYKENRPFDYDMTLDSEDELFCTELVWRAILDVTGKDVSPEKIPWRGKILIGFLPFFRGPDFEPIYMERHCPVFQKTAIKAER
jgi:hypothetical protein